MKLYPDGMMQVSLKELEDCPWFWSRARECWLFRPAWATLRGQALTNAANG